MINKPQFFHASALIVQSARPKPYLDSRSALLWRRSPAFTQIQPQSSQAPSSAPGPSKNQDTIEGLFSTFAPCSFARCVDFPSLSLSAPPTRTINQSEKQKRRKEKKGHLSRTMALSQGSLSTRLIATLIFLILGMGVGVRAQATTTASIYPAPTGWSYYGCYNETTLTNGTEGQRALNGGIMEALDTMTVPICLEYCKSHSFTFAGIEYTRYVLFLLVFSRILHYWYGLKRWKLTVGTKMRDMIRKEANYKPENATARNSSRHFLRSCLTPLAISPAKATALKSAVAPSLSACTRRNPRRKEPE